MVKLFLFSVFFIHSFTSQASSECSKTDSSLRDIASILASNKTDLCSYPEVGKYRDFDIGWDFSPTSVDHRYRHLKTGENRSSIIFNIDFSPSKFVETGFNLNNFSDGWRNKTKQCLNRFKDKFRAPDGEIVNFELYDPSKHGKKPSPKVSIGISDKGTSHSRDWAKDIRCGTILHELLHLAGLVDEYHEPEYGFTKNPQTGVYEFTKENPEKLGFDCRKHYNDNSIMDYSFAEDELIETGLCECREGKKESCQSYMDRDRLRRQKLYIQSNDPAKIVFKQLEVCPESFTQNHKQIIPLKPIDSTGLKNTNYIAGGLGKYGENKDAGGGASGFRIGGGYLGGGVGSVTNGGVIDGKPVSERPIVLPTYRVIKNPFLRPRHYNSILFPTCAPKNRKYYDEAKGAYRSSYETGGNGCPNSDWVDEFSND